MLEGPVHPTKIGTAAELWKQKSESRLFIMRGEAEDKINYGMEKSKHWHSQDISIKKNC